MANEPSRPARPNAIWIFGDQHRAQALSCMGDPNVNTPELDRLAVEGVMSNAAVAGCPLCCPFRGSLLSSQYPHKCTPGHEMEMPEMQRTVAHAFKDAGYHTAYFGKWHLDGFKEREGRAAKHIVPPHRRGGFDTWIGYENNNSQWDCWVHGGEGEQAFHRRLDGYETDCLSDMLIEHVRKRGSAENADEPFFAVLSVQPPHDPYLAPPQFMGLHNPAQLQMRENVPNIARVQQLARRELAGAYAQIENLDWNVGRIRAALKAAGLEHNTHIVFFSDHGDMHGSHGQFRKTSPWEEAIRIPFIIGGAPTMYGHWVGVQNRLINHVDIAPTTLGLCGIDKPAWMAGTDYSAMRQRGKSIVNEPDSAFLQLVVPTVHGDSLDRPWRGVVTKDRWKYVCIEGQPWGMYNLNEDPYELVNLAFNSRFRVERKRLQDRLGQWISDTGDTFKLPDIS